MANLKQRLRRKNADGSYDTIYLQADLSNVTGTLAVANGGTGRATLTSKAILAGNGTSAVSMISVASGALYSTGTSTAAKFGTLPVAQGGTGATTSAGARSNLGAASSSHNHSATAITYGSSSNVGAEIDSLKSSVSNGKSLIASAITDKGVSTASDATFQTMATNIGQIKSLSNTMPSFTYTGSYSLDDASVYGLSGSYKVLALKSSGILTFASVFDAQVFAVGGGGSGITMGGASTGFGGGGGYTTTNRIIITTTPYDVIIGAGGMRADSSSQTYNPGQDTSLSNSDAYVLAKGGNTINYSCGGSGGGISGNGGSDGGNGEGYSVQYNRGIGQGTTTRAFKDPNGKLFAGGGRAGLRADAAANTGGGGDGGAGGWSASGAGGSGIILIRGTV